MSQAVGEIDRERKKTYPNNTGAAIELTTAPCRGTFLKTILQLAVGVMW
jgi:hypothetical protein